MYSITSTRSYSGLLRRMCKAKSSTGKRAGKYSPSHFAFSAQKPVCSCQLISLSCSLVTLIMVVLYDSITIVSEGTSPTSRTR